MNKSQVNRAVVAARAPKSRPNQVAMLRPMVLMTSTGPVRRTTAAPLTRMQRDSTGKRSDWAASPYYFTDPAWDLTVSHPVR